MNTQTEYGWTALMSAVRNNHVESADILVQSGADVNVQKKDGSTALLLLQPGYQHQVKLFKILISTGADVNINDNTGKSVMQNVLRYFRKTIENVKLLYAAGANVNMVDINTDTAALHGERSEILKLMFAAGENIDEAGQDATRIKQELNPELELNLSHLSRDAIRKHLLQMSSLNLVQQIPKLGLPEVLQKFLLYNIKLEDEDTS